MKLYYYEDDKRIGPVTTVELRALARRGVVVRATLLETSAGFQERAENIETIAPNFSLEKEFAVADVLVREIPTEAPEIVASPAEPPKPVALSEAKPEPAEPFETKPEPIVPPTKASEPSASLSESNRVAPVPSVPVASPTKSAESPREIPSSAFQEVAARSSAPKVPPRSVQPQSRPTPQVQTRPVPTQIRPAQTQTQSKPLLQDAPKQPEIRLKDVQKVATSVARPVAVPPNASQNAQNSTSQPKNGGSGCALLFFFLFIGFVLKACVFRDAPPEFIFFGSIILFFMFKALTSKNNSPKDQK